jgi:hypothetical protein
MDDGLDDVVMQTRCIGCKKEQYAPGVFAISHGEARCGVCGLRPPVFTEEAAYLEALNDLDWRGATGLY